jgi:hypothetical protein
MGRRRLVGEMIFTAPSQGGGNKKRRRRMRADNEYPGKLTNVPAYADNRNVKTDMCSRVGFTTDAIYIIVQSSGRVLERYRGKRIYLFTLI